MARDLFSVPIFFIVFRETLEAAIIISVLLGLVEQIVHDDPACARALAAPRLHSAEAEDEKRSAEAGSQTPEGDAGPDAAVAAAAAAGAGAVAKRALIRKMRIQVRAHPHGVA